MTVHNWQQGTKPNLLTAVETARDRGWMTPAAPEPACALTALAAWLAAFGTLRQNYYYPVFRVHSPAQRAWFQTFTDQFDLSFSARLEDDMS